jgi:CRP/FNR family transcriptional regulator, cyclic AMP receptor protein
VDTQQRAELLARSALFREVDHATLRRIAERVTERVFAKGQLVFKQDAPGDRVFVLAEGVVKLYVSSRGQGIIELVRHEPPAVFGEVALLDGGPRSASARAVERSVVLELTHADLLQLLRAEEHVAEALLRLLGTMVRRTTNQVTDLAFLNLPGRVAAKLLELAGPAGPGPARTRRVTQGELATMVGAARQSVNQALKSLEARGLVRTTGRSFEILDRDGLQRLAEG